ncbi:hypothetical protein [Taibaiella chishuiensis]|uniref:DUF4468 domain-containing protein n=1 Tax=Taibaiella chishuiensis TaxID=1434707 RepID=A0A2P8CVA4_9BACT|nr:hypothetical protein [Taibaiella chishuiensis]PSK88895.1 hypothetical protein B0I18_114107 [Taibaiella chishuiensis]
MKKTLIAVLLLAANGAFAQNLWTGSSIPTTTNGKVGIGLGTTAPDASLSILRPYSFTPFEPVTPQPALKIQSSTSSQLAAPGNIFEIYRAYKGLGFPGTMINELTFAAENNGGILINTKLRIGPTQATGAFADYRLSVDGTLVAKRCVVQVDNWADFVFHDAYALPELEDVAQFVNEHKHLPGVPSEAELKEKGLEVVEMNRILMQKVEELTLYVIKQQKEIDALKVNTGKH